jgi:tetratricopeptide (TPR) repeat protein
MGQPLCTYEPNLKLFLILTGFLVLYTHSGALAQDPLLEAYEEGRYDEVIRNASEVISAGDSSLNPYYLKALSQIQLGNNDEAIATLEQALLLFPGEIRFRKLLALQYDDTGNYSKAESLYKAFISQDSSDLNSLIKLAEIESFRQNYRGSDRILKQVLKLDSTNLTGLMMEGENLTKLNNPEAIGFYEKALRLYPGNQQAAYALGNWYIQADTPGKALPVCEQILAVDPVNIKFHKLMGFAFYRSGEPGKAIEPFEKAVALGDSTVFTDKYLGISRYLTMDFPGAIPQLESAVTRDSTDADIRFFLGSSLATTTRKKEAMHHLDRALELMQPDPVAVARIYSEQGNLKRLESEYEQAYELYWLSWEADTTNPMALYYMASILDNSLHRSREALVDYRRFIDQLDRMPVTGSQNKQVPTLREIVEDRIIQLKEELFFLDEQ